MMERKIINKNDIQAFYKKAIKSGNPKDEIVMPLFEEQSPDDKKGDFLHLLKVRENNKNKYLGFVYEKGICVFSHEQSKDENVTSNFNTLTSELYDYLLAHKLIKIPYETQKAMQLENLVDDLDLHNIFKDYIKIDDETNRLLYSDERSAILKTDKETEFKSKISEKLDKEKIRKVQKLAGEFNKNPSTSTREAIAIAKLVLNHTKDEYLGDYYLEYLRDKQFYWNYIFVVLKKEKELFEDIRKKFSYNGNPFFWKDKSELRYTKPMELLYNEKGRIVSILEIDRALLNEEKIFNKNKEEISYKSLLPTLFQLGPDDDWLGEIYIKLGAHLDSIARSYDPNYNTDSGKKESSFKTYIYNEIKKKITSIWMESKYKTHTSANSGMTLTKQDETLLYRFGGKLDFALSKYYNDIDNFGQNPDEEFLAGEINKSIKERHVKREARDRDFITAEQVKQIMTLRNQQMIGFTYQDGDEEIELPIASEDFNPRKELLEKEESQFSDRIFNQNKFFKREHYTRKIFDEKNISEAGFPEKKVQVLKDWALMTDEGKKVFDEYKKKEEKDELKKEKLLQILGEINSVKSKSVSLMQLLEIKGKKVKELESDESKKEIISLFEDILDTYKHIGENMFVDSEARKYIFKNNGIDPRIFPNKPKKDSAKFTDYLDNLYKNEQKLDLMKSLYFVTQLKDVPDWERDVFVLATIFHNTNFERIKYYIEEKYKEDGIVLTTAGNQIHRICFQTLLKLKTFIYDLFEDSELKKEE